MLEERDRCQVWSCSADALWSTRLFSRNSSQEFRELGAIDVHGYGTSRRQGQLESCSMQALVQHAGAIPLEPQQLQSGGASIREDEYRAALHRIVIAVLTRRLGQPIEATSHVDRLRADEDSNPAWDHAVLASTARSRSSDSTSNAAGIRRRLPPLSSSSNALPSAEAACTSISGSVASTRGCRSLPVDDRQEARKSGEVHR